MKRDWTEAKKKCVTEGRCRVCKRAPSQQHPLTPAHLVHRGMGGDMSADNIVPLCIVHHSAFDKHKLDILPYLTTDEQVTMVRLSGSIESARRRALPSEYSSYAEKTGRDPKVYDPQ